VTKKATPVARLPGGDGFLLSPCSRLSGLRLFLGLRAAAFFRSCSAFLLSNCSLLGYVTEDSSYLVIRSSVFSSTCGTVW